jgi:hypothetical protein
MAEEESKGVAKSGVAGLDPVGLKATAETGKMLVEAGIDAAGAFLGRICLPFAEELGKYFQDKVAGWRALQFISIAQKTEKKLAEAKATESVHAPPRIVHAIVEQGSWIDDPAVQDMWAGLLSSSCTEDGDDDSNLIFVNMLGNFTKLQARVMKFACEEVKKTASPANLIQAGELNISFEKLCEIARESDLQRLDRELDHLRGMGLLEGGIDFDQRTIVDLSPTSLALHMYVRCQGSRLSPTEFFKLAQPPAEPPQSSPPA